MIRDTDLSKAQYERAFDTMRANGATLSLGKHEGSTLSLGPVHLCASDGYYWLSVEIDDGNDDNDWPEGWEWADDGAIVVRDQAA